MRRIVVDMSGVRFMDSSGLNVILAQRMRMVESGGSIHICNPSPAVKRVVELTGLEGVLFAPLQSDAYQPARELSLRVNDDVRTTSSGWNTTC